MRKKIAIIFICSFFLIIRCGEEEVITIETPSGIVKRDIIARSPKIAFSEEGIPNIVFVNMETLQGEFGIKSGENWDVTKIPPAYPLFKIGRAIFASGGIFTFSAHNPQYGRLALFQKSAGAWLWTAIDEGGVGEDSYFVEDKDGGFHISYIDQTRLDLNYAYLKLGLIERETVDPGYIELRGGGEVFSGTSITLSEDGIPHISYYEGFHGVLKHAWLKSDKTGWEIEVVDPTPDRGRYSSIFYSKTCKCLRIAYYDLKDRNLLLAEKNGGSWKIESIDHSPFTVGKEPIFKEASDGALLIFYKDDSNKALRLAIKRKGWKIYQISPLREDSCPVLLSEFDVELFGNKMGILIADWLNKELRYIEEDLGNFQ